MRVRWAECDPQGVVFNAHYLMYLDETLTELWRTLRPGGYAAMLDDDVDLVLAEANLRFRASARFDEEIDVELRVTRLGNTALTTAGAIVRGDETLLEADLRHVFINRGTAEKMRIPDSVRAGLERFATQEA